MRYMIIFIISRLYYLETFSTMSEEIPQFDTMLPLECEQFHKSVNQILDTYQHHLSVTLYMTGSVALQRAIAPYEKWHFEDMDELITGISSREEFDRHALSVQKACHQLGGETKILYYPLRECGKEEMKNVIGKVICLFSKDILPGIAFRKINVTFITGTFADHIRDAKPPAVVLYEASKPNVVIIPNHRWFRMLTKRQLPSYDYKKDDDSIITKYAQRGFHPLVADESKRTGSDYTHVPKDQIVTEIKEQKWRAAVTAKIHYRAGAAWRLAQNIVSISALLMEIVFTLEFRPVGLVSLYGSIIFAWFMAQYPNRNAREHQRAGARYAGLENEWRLLYSKIEQGRIRLDWADSQTQLLQREKCKLDRISPNSPEFWKKGVISEIKHKYLP
jgi:hypothetical protein